MRTVFFGTPELAVPALAAVAAHHNVTAVVCQPDRPKKRSKRPVPPPTKAWAVEHEIPVHQPLKLNDGAFEAWLKEQRPELCAIAAYGRLLKQPILDVPPEGWLNIHPSLLPRYRGPSPIQSAILNGDPVTGVSIMRLTLEMDAGDVLLQEETPVADDDTTESLSARLAQLGATALLRGIDLVASGNAVFTPQDHDKATYCGLFEKRHGRIRWEAPARTVHNLVRAAVPWPVAHCLFNGEVYRIYKTAVADEAADAAPGTVIRAGQEELVVAAGEGALALEVLQAPGRRALPVNDFLRGHALRPGDRFENCPDS